MTLSLAQCTVVKNHRIWLQIWSRMCLTLSVSVEGLEMKGSGDHGVFQGMESQHLTNMVSVERHLSTQRWLVSMLDEGW